MAHNGDKGGSWRRLMIWKKYEVFFTDYGGVTGAQASVEGGSVRLAA
jgi:hypothetical protein